MAALSSTHAAPKAASVWLFNQYVVGTSHLALFCDANGVNRLTTRAQFQAVLAGKTLARTAHFALHSIVLQEPGLDLFALKFAVGQSAWMGAMVPKRWAKRAVTRNTLKRQIYARSAECAKLVPERAYVLRLRSSFDRSVFVSATSQALKDAVRRELQQLFDALPAAPAPLVVGVVHASA